MKKKRPRKRARSTPATMTTAERAIARKLRQRRAPLHPDDPEPPPPTWSDPTAPGHQGSILGILWTMDDGSTVALGSREGERMAVAAPDEFQIACVCGWRSRVFRAPTSAMYRPPTFRDDVVYDLNDPQTEEAARVLWLDHAGRAELEAALPLEPRITSARILPDDADD